MQKRLDIFLFENKFVRSRSHATDLIKRGKVFVDGVIIKKQSALVDDSSTITIDSDTTRVGRGGEKLELVISKFKLNFENKVVVDIGSSTGGFTEVALNHGARKVYAVDVGIDQLDPKIRTNEKVVVLENTDIRNASKNTFALPIEIALVDVSFISLKEILPIASKIISKNGIVVALVKPQFESGYKGTKKGVVSDQKERQLALKKVSEYALSSNFKIIAETESPIEGKKGNKEFFLFLKKTNLNN